MKNSTKPSQISTLAPAKEVAKAVSDLAAEVHTARANGATAIAVGDREIVLSATRLNKIKVQPGEHYKMVRITRKDNQDIQELADDVIAVKQGEHLVLRFFDGTSLVLEEFYAVCQDPAACSVTLAGGTAEGYVLGASPSSGESAGQDSTLVYAHGVPERLMYLAGESGGLQDALAAHLASTSPMAGLPTGIDALETGIGAAMIGLLSLGAGASYTDTAGNAGGAGTTPAISIDTLAPTLAITSNKSALKAGEAATITFTFSEDPGSTFVWDGSAGDVVVTGGTLGAISGSGLSRTATFTPTANLAAGSASITVAGASYTDTAGNAGGAGTTPAISIDTLAPVQTTTITAITDNVGTVANGGVTDDTSLVLSGSVSAALGAGELVRVFDGSTYLGNATVTGTTWSYADSRTLITQQTVSYTARVADAAGNQGTDSGAYTATVASATIDLGVNGQLIAPVQVEGKLYYFWDRDKSNNATSADTITMDGLEQLAFGSNVGTVFTESNRTFTLNGVTLALPTDGLPDTVLNSSVSVSGTSWSNATAGWSTSTSSNATYDDLLAIWDAFNGTSTGAGLQGVPAGWGLSYYWSATPSASGHAYVYLGDGYVYDDFDNDLNHVALQVL